MTNELAVISKRMAFFVYSTLHGKIVSLQGMLIMERDKSSLFFSILGLLLTIFVILFGDNIYEQFTGHSVFDQPDNDSANADDFEPSPTPRPLKRVYKSISLTDWSEHDSTETNLGLSPGSHTLVDIPFNTGWTATTECQHLPSQPESFEFDLSISNPSAVHLLIQAGNAFTRYENNQIGVVVLEFSNGDRYEKPLILGSNIRDWAWENNAAVNTASSPNLKPAWSGESSAGVTGGMDVLTIPIPPDQANSTLTKLILTDQSRSNGNDINPCIHLLALTVENLE